VQAIRVYADTSVFGGIFDDGFASASRAFITQVIGGRFQLVTSAIVREELLNAPSRVRAEYDRAVVGAEVLSLTTESLELQQAYLDARIVGPASDADALHVAMASVARCSFIISWNFKHIVHFQKIPLYNGINVARGYSSIGIYSPSEVIAYE
jgi:predicted nucleic acid-binding protein